VLLARLEVLMTELEALPTALVGLDVRQTTAGLLEDPTPAPGLLQDLRAIEDAAAGMLPLWGSPTPFPPFRGPATQTFAV
jgi:hypothetical protein